jgi:hypothetical protein
MLTTILMASMKSIGTAGTMAGVGIYFHRRGMITNHGKRTLALISQQVTFPLYLFTKLLYCSQNGSQRPCPDITMYIHDVWILFIWPIYVVAIGEFD